MTDETGFPQELVDAANRMRDGVNLHVLAGTFGERRIGFVAIRLSDGRSHQNTLFDSRKDAVRATANLEKGWFYVKVGAQTMGEREAIMVLQMARQAFKNGVVFAETDPVVPMLSELALPYIPKTLHRLGLVRPERRNSR
jgi:hypothetical protein